MGTLGEPAELQADGDSDRVHLISLRKVRGALAHMVFAIERNENFDISES